LANELSYAFDGEIVVVVDVVVGGGVVVDVVVVGSEASVVLLVDVWLLTVDCSTLVAWVAVVEGLVEGVWVASDSFW
jgi:hypothetical protein